MIRRLLFRNFNTVFIFDRWIRQRFTKAGMLVLGGMIAAGVFGIDTRQTLAYQLFALLFVLLSFGILSSWFFRIRLTAQRHKPRFATVDEPVHYHISVSNHTSRLQKELLIRENLSLQPPSFATFLRVKEPGYEKRNRFDKYVGYPRWLWLMARSQGAEIVEKKLPPLPPNKNLVNAQESDTSLTVNMTLLPKRRGYIVIKGLIFACPDAFGLFYALYQLPLADKILVLPKRYPVGKISLPGSRKYQRGGVQLAMSVGDTEEFVSLREYRPGDPLRHIHWKSWAKLGKPVVKEFQDEFFIRHALILDTFTDEIMGEDFETAVSVAASFANAPRNQEVLLDLMFVGHQAYRFTSGRGLAASENLLEILAVVEPATQQTFDQLASLVMQHLASLSGVICVLLDWDFARQQFIKTLKQAGIPLLVVIIKTSPLKKILDNQNFPEVHSLNLNQLADELSRLSL